jgi:hypothetical protein
MADKNPIKITKGILGIKPPGTKPIPPPAPPRKRKPLDKGIRINGK